MRKLLVRVAVATAFAGVLAGIGAGTASAAQPTDQACFGQSVSANAQALHPYGQVVLAPNAPRSDFGKISDAVHLVQAGQVDDSIFPATEDVRWPRALPPSATTVRAVTPPRRGPAARGPVAG